MLVQLYLMDIHGVVVIRILAVIPHIVKDIVKHVMIMVWFLDVLRGIV